MTLSELRIKKKMTQEDVARKSGLSVRYISMVENGQRNLSDKAKKKLAEIYKVKVTDIFLALERTKCTVEKGA